MERITLLLHKRHGWEAVDSIFLSCMLPIGSLGRPSPIGVWLNIFEKVTIALDPAYYPGKSFTIEAHNVSDKNRYIQSATLDGKPLTKPWFYHSDLVDGGSLVLEMGPEPNMNWGSKPGDAPPSMSMPVGVKKHMP